MSRSPEESGLKRRLTAAQLKGGAYQGAVEAVFAILIGAGLGYWADEHFGSAPRYLVIGVVVGFGAFVLRLLRLGEQMRELSEQADRAVNSNAEPQEGQLSSDVAGAESRKETRK